jgi:hypothetical protein
VKTINIPQTHPLCIHPTAQRQGCPLCLNRPHRYPTATPCHRLHQLRGLQGPNACHRRCLQIVRPLILFDSVKMIAVLVNTASRFSGCSVPNSTTSETHEHVPINKASKHDMPETVETMLTNLQGSRPNLRCLHLVVGWVDPEVLEFVLVEDCIDLPLVVVVVLAKDTNKMFEIDTMEGYLSDNDST